MSDQKPKETYVLTAPNARQRTMLAAATLGVAAALAKTSEAPILVSPSTVEHGGPMRRRDNWSQRCGHRNKRHAARLRRKKLARASRKRNR